MCTVTFIARKHGYALGMNRDEKLTRVQALPPAHHELNGRAALFPSEPGGGTWIGVNEAGVTLALINWYSVPARVRANPVSRGLVVRSALASDTASQLDEDLGTFASNRTNPFRLIGVFPNDRQVIEWRWNLRCVERIEHHWKSNTWISSGFDESGAEKTRRDTFRCATEGRAVQNLRWLRKLHSSHAPSRGPYSHCMHREDAATVSYTEITVSGSAARMAYLSGSPCCRRMKADQSLELALDRSLLRSGWPVWLRPLLSSASDGSR
jgi:hypothetical protein